MASRFNRAYAAVTVLASACALAGSGCAINRPARNGVFNENQYLRKDFLVTPAAGGQDPGWFVKSTILSTTVPNVLANIDGGGLLAGIMGVGANFIRFQITQDKLQMLNLREISTDPTLASQGLATPEIVNAWPVTNVDLKYQVNLDGERTNFFQENQELDWQQRQWVKINFANNNMADLWSFGANINPVLQHCTSMTDASTTLVTDSFLVDTANQSFEFTLSITVPVAFSDTDEATCMAAFGSSAVPFFELGRQNVTLNVRTVFVRPGAPKDPSQPGKVLVDGTYVPFTIAEKDPIQKKYGLIQQVLPYRDPTTGLLSAQEVVNRYNPNNDIYFYFSQGMPQPYIDFFTKPGMLVDKTNAILKQSGAKGQLHMLNYNDLNTLGDGQGPNRQPGDPRYSFIIWHTDNQYTYDTGLLGVEQAFTDPRTGETISSNVNVFEGPFSDTVLQKLDLFLQTVGAEYLNADGSFNDAKYPASCMPGDVVPLVPADVASAFNRQSTVFGKMQTYLQKPYATYGYLGPADFLPASHDQDFYNAYFAVVPYQTYADPQANAFVTPESGSFGLAPQAYAAKWQALQSQAQFQALASSIDKGLEPFDSSGPTAVPDAASFIDNWTNLSMAVTDWEHARRYSKLGHTADDLGLFSYFDVYQKAGRHCTAAGKWEDRTTFTTNLIQSLNMVVAAHEFGHALGLDHNFMGSIDQRNFPLSGEGNSKGNPTMYSSSIMDYNQQVSEAFFEQGGNGPSPIWGPYDAAALGFIYGNNLSANGVGPVATTQTPTGISGQVSPTAPWNDPLGFGQCMMSKAYCATSDQCNQMAGDTCVQGSTETPYITCSNQHTKYTPLCRPYDLGVTPSEIEANDLQRREWNYLWTNFRLYHKYFSTENYPNNVANDFNEMRRFTSLWAFDWSGGELVNTLRLIGTQVPPGTTAADYYNQLTNKFNTDISVANQLQATYHRAIIEQASGERPFITVYDPFYGDVTQQGIQLDKVQALASMTVNWPAVSNYDPSQSTGLFLTSVGGEIGDNAYTTVSAAVLNDLLGASYATYTYTQVSGLASWAAASHSAAFGGNLQMQTWVGGWAFNRDRDFLDFIHKIAVDNNFPNCDENGQNCQPCTSIDSCTWDPRFLATKTSYVTQSDRYNRFQGPDGRTYIWGYIKSRNQWVLADRDRNTATYALMLQWTTDIVNGEDDGYNGSQSLEYKVRYVVDAFTYYDMQTLAAP